MTEPAKSTGNSEVSGNTFGGPTGAQVGSSNTQINHYTVPSTSPGRAGRGARIALMIAAALLVGGVIVFTAIEFATNSGRTTQPLTTPAGKPEVHITPVGEGDLCVDVEGNRDVPGSTVQLWNCNQEDGQVWTPHDDRTIQGVSRCLAAKNEETANGTPVVLSDCTTGGDQQWEWLDPQGPGQGKLHNLQSDRCLGYLPQRENSDRDAPLAIYDCDSEFARVWTFR